MSPKRIELKAPEYHVGYFEDGKPVAHATGSTLHEAIARLDRNVNYIAFMNATDPSRPVPVGYTHANHQKDLLNEIDKIRSLTYIETKYNLETHYYEPMERPTSDKPGPTMSTIPGNDPGLLPQGSGVQSRGPMETVQLH